jgi:hypothetical protein
MLTGRDFQTARHEAAHAAAAHLMFWEVTSVERFKDGQGVTNITPRTDGDIRERGIEAAMILLAAVTIEPAGASEDLQKLGELADSGIPLATVYRRTRGLLSTDEFMDLHSAITDALWRSPTLNAPELAIIFGLGVASDVPDSASLQGDVRGTTSVPTGAPPA